MKKYKTITAILCTFVALIFIGCESEGSKKFKTQKWGGGVTYTISFYQTKTASTALSSPATQTVAKNAKATEPTNAPTSPTNADAGFMELPTGQDSKNAYFNGWYTDENKKWTFASDNVTGDLKLHAKWLPKLEIKASDAKKKITNPKPPTNAEIGLALNNAPNKDYKGYFMGWYSGADFKKKYAFSVNEDITLVGKWSETKYQPANKRALQNLLFSSGTPTPANKIDTSKITNMKDLFSTTSFNEDISGWDVSKVENMESIFLDARAFNQDIGSWNVGKVTNMEAMFQGAYAFNQDIGSWDVGKVENMEAMFASTISFNQDISSWNVGNVTNMEAMFFYTTAFKQNMSGWNWNPSCAMKKSGVQDMFTNSGVTKHPTFYTEFLKKPKDTDTLAGTPFCTPATP